MPNPIYEQDGDIPNGDGSQRVEPRTMDFNELTISSSAHVNPTLVDVHDPPETAGYMATVSARLSTELWERLWSAYSSGTSGEIEWDEISPILVRICAIRALGGQELPSDDDKSDDDDADIPDLESAPEEDSDALGGGGRAFGSWSSSLRVARSPYGGIADYMNAWRSGDIGRPVSHPPGTWLVDEWAREQWSAPATELLTQQDWARTSSEHPLPDDGSDNE